ncbi:MAG: DUF2079 domain-containing protein [Patescibacteria group bacterium]
MPVFKNKINIILNRRASLFLWLVIAIYTAVFIFLALKRYYYFTYNVSDLAIFNQVFFNTLHGRWFQETITLNSYLGDHFSPIIILLLPFYAIKPGPQVLLILQTIFLGLSAWPLYLIAKQVTKNIQLSLLAAIAWLLSPFVQSANLDESHLMYMAAFLVLFCFYFYLKNNYKLFLLFFILALLVREDISFILLAFFGLSFFDKKSVKWKITSILLPISYFILAVFIIKYFSLAGNYKYFIYYGWLGGKDLWSIFLSWLSHPIAFLAHLFSWRNISSLAIVLLPLLFLPILKPKYLLLSLLPFLQLALGTAGFSSVAYSSRFVLLILPGIFVALIFALDKISQREKFLGSGVVYNNFGFFKFIFIFTLLYFAVFLSPARHILARTYPAGYHEQVVSFLQEIPDTAIATAQVNLLPALSNRSTLYNLDYAYFGVSQFVFTEFEMPEVDYIVVDYNDFLTTLSEAQKAPTRAYWPNMAKHWRQILSGYGLVRAENNMYLWQNKKFSQRPELKLYDFSALPDKIEQGMVVYGQRQIDGDRSVLKISYQKTGDQEKNYLVRFYRGEYYFDLPLDYGLLPVKDWPDDKLVNFYYYPEVAVDSYQVFYWSGDNKLGQINEVYLDAKLEPLGGRVSF